MSPRGNEAAGGAVVSSAFDEIKRAYLAGRADGVHAAEAILATFTRENTSLESGINSEAFARLCEVRNTMITLAASLRPRGTQRINDPDGPELVEEVAMWPQPRTAIEVRTVRETAARERRSVASMVEGAQGSIAKGVQSLESIVDVVESIVGKGGTRHE